MTNITLNLDNERLAYRAWQQDNEGRTSVDGFDIWLAARRHTEPDHFQADTPSIECASIVREIALKNTSAHNIGEYYEFNADGFGALVADIVIYLDQKIKSALINAAPSRRTPLSSEARDQAHAAGWNACLDAIGARSAHSPAILTLPEAVRDKVDGLTRDLYNFTGGRHFALRLEEILQAIGRIAVPISPDNRESETVLRQLSDEELSDPDYMRAYIDEVQETLGEYIHLVHQARSASRNITLDEVAKLCDEMEEHYSAIKDSALLNHDMQLSLATSGEPRACRFIAERVRELKATSPVDRIPRLALRLSVDTALGAFVIGDGSRQQHNAAVDYVMSAVNELSVFSRLKGRA